MKELINKLSSTSPLLLPVLLVLIGASILLSVHSDHYFHPNQVRNEAVGDKAKNYYTFSWHIHHDQKPHHFEGMHYPYGDRLTYADAQPLLSNFVWILARIIPPLKKQGPAILHYAMLLSWLAGLLLWYAVFRKWKLPLIWAALGALAISLLSPQNQRILHGHFSLGHLFVFPLVLLLLWGFIENPNWRKSLWISLVIFLSGWFHPYMVVILAVFLSGFHILRFFQQKTWNERGKAILFASLQIILPLLLFMLINSLLDAVSDRPPIPNGVIRNRLEFRNSFLPLWNGPLGAQWFPEDFSMEGWNYAGIGAFLIGIWWVIRAIPLMIVRLLQKKKKPLRYLAPSVPGKSFHALWAGALLAFIFATGFPFWGDLKELAYAVPVMNQFRSVGRIGWGWYYGLFALSTLFLHRLNRAWRIKGGAKRFFAWILPAAFLILCLIEGIGWQRWLNAHQPHPEPVAALEDSEWQNSINPDEYEAMIVFPFFHIGSEDISYSGKRDGKRLAFGLSESTGLPMFDAMMSRTSLQQTLNLVAMQLAPGKPLAIREDLPKSGKVLVLRWKNAKLPPLFRQSKVIGNHHEVELREFELETLAAFHGNAIPWEKRVGLNQPGVLYHGQGDGSGQGYLGTEGYGGPSKKLHQVWASKPDLNPGDTVLVSIWIPVNTPRALRLGFGLKLFDSKTGERTHRDYHSAYSHLMELHGGWGRVERRIPIQEGKDSILIELTQEVRPPYTLNYDEVVVRELKMSIPDSLKVEE